ncbi:DUF2975 domain-containing protein [Clostridium sp. Marseille-P2415]|uniref:DUF2975 domain-containing protein n=1 Tax=Clostridium sp. Marseille-P2415 TaxID=1805471 RepID=UPI00098867A2|nr:DUF2975 domain-containing protein [Clostridium sp. Marseille-P2415]
MWTKCKSLKLSVVLVKMVFFTLILSVFLIPAGVKWFDLVSSRSDLFIPICISLYIALIPAFIIIAALDRLLSNIRKEQIFIDQNVTILRVISWCCFAVSIDFIIFMVFGFRFPVYFFLSFAAAFFGLILRVLKNVFEQAVALQIENDFTI